MAKKELQEIHHKLKVLQYAAVIDFERRFITLQG